MGSSDPESEGDLGQGDIEEAVLAGECEIAFRLEMAFLMVFLVSMTGIVRSSELALLLELLLKPLSLLSLLCVREWSRRASDRVNPNPHLSTWQTNNFSEVWDRI